jgi:microcystin degradation protein MlrC
VSRRVLSLQIAHETNSFSIRPATLAAYRARQWLEGPAVADALRGANHEIAAHLEAAERWGWTLVQPIACFATPCGPTPAADWAEMRAIVGGALEDGPFDGVALALHGAMIAQGEDDAEGALLAMARDRLGPDVPIALTLDLHANVSDRMAALADIVVAYRTYPHVDMRETGDRACALLEAAMAGRARFRTAVQRAPTLMGADFGRTTDPDGCMTRMLARAARIEAEEEGIDAISIYGGFPWADIPDAGPSVTVTGRGERTRLEAVADGFAAEIWSSRDERSVAVTPMEVAVREACDGARGGPLVISDFTDNPGMGGYGDHVGLLRALMEAGAQDALVLTIADPETAAACVAAGDGARLAVRLGSRVDPALYGPPLEAEAEVLRAGDLGYVNEGPMFAGLRMRLGPSALIRLGGVEAAVVTNTLQTVDLNMARAFGVEPAARRTVVVKSAQHFRAAYGPIARAVRFVDSGALCSQNFGRFPFTRLRRPLHGLDADVAFAPA